MLKGLKGIKIKNANFFYKDIDDTHLANVLNLNLFWFEASNYVLFKFL